MTRDVLTMEGRFDWGRYDFGTFRRRDFLTMGCFDCKAFKDLVAVELPFIPTVIDCMHQTIKTYLESDILLSVRPNRTLCVYQVGYGVGRCVKDGSCSPSSLE